MPVSEGLRKMLRMVIFQCIGSYNRRQVIAKTLEISHILPGATLSQGFTNWRAVGVSWAAHGEMSWGTWGTGTKIPGAIPISRCIQQAGGLPKTCRWWVETCQRSLWFRRMGMLLWCAWDAPRIFRSLPKDFAGKGSCSSVWHFLDDFSLGWIIPYGFVWK